MDPVGVTHWMGLKLWSQGQPNPEPGPYPARRAHLLAATECGSTHDTAVHSLCVRGMQVQHICGVMPPDTDCIQYVLL